MSDPSTRPPATGGLLATRVPQLDGLRALAIAVVVGTHAGVPYMGGGSLGVTMFFVLSGFLITTILLRPRVLTRSGIVQFYLRRWLRLFPALAFVVLFVVGYALVFMEGEERRFNLVQALASITYTNNLYMGRGRETEDFGLLGQTWSLGVEEQFYVVWPLLLLGLTLAVRSAAGRAVVILAVAGCFTGWRMYLSSQGYAAHVGMNIDTQADSLLVGAALAAVFPAVRGWGERRQGLLTVGAVLALLFMLAEVAIEGLHHLAPHDLNYTLVAVATAVVITRLLTPATGRFARMGLAVFSWGPVVWIGVLSYSLYLWHRVVFEVLRDFVTIETLRQQLTWGVPAIVMALLAAMVSYYCVERPFLRLKDARYGTGVHEATPASGFASPAPATPPTPDAEPAGPSQARQSDSVEAVPALSGRPRDERGSSEQPKWLLLVVGALAVAIGVFSLTGTSLPSLTTGGPTQPVVGATKPVSCAPTAARPGPQIDLGVQSATRGGHLAPSTVAGLVRSAERAGATIISTAASFRTLQLRERGDYRWNRLDRTVRAARARGMQVRFQLVGLPQWARSDQGDQEPWTAPRTRSELAAWRTFVTDLTRRYADDVRYFEIWNEPNEADFWPTGPDPEEYARLLQVSYDAIKQVDASVQVVSGGLSNNDIGFLQSLYDEFEAGPGPTPFDMLGIHPFNGDRAPDTDLTAWRHTREPYGEFDQNFLGFRRMHEVLTEHGDDDLGLYIGEFGYSTEPWQEFDPVSDTQRAEYLTQAFEATVCSPFVEVFSWYYFHPTPWNDSSWTLLDDDLEPTETYRALVQWSGRVDSLR